jgi:hypothetical protein
MKPFMLAIVTSVTLGAAPIIAAGQHGPKAQPTAKSTHAQAPQTKPSTTKPPMVKPATAATPVKPTTPSMKASKTTKTTKPATTTAPAKMKPVETKPAAIPVKSTKSATETKKAVTTKAAKTEPRSTTTPTAPTTTVTLTPVQQKLLKNTNLASKLQTRLPPGTNLLTAADGFRNLGQFVAAVNVSNNLGIPFADLKTKLVTQNFSLGQSIQSLKPVSSPTVEAQRAEYDARGMIADSERQAAPAPTKLKAKSKTSSTASQK